MKIMLPVGLLCFLFTCALRNTVIWWYESSYASREKKCAKCSDTFIAGCGYLWNYTHFGDICPICQPLPYVSLWVNHHAQWARGRDYLVEVGIASMREVSSSQRTETHKVFLTHIAVVAYSVHHPHRGLYREYLPNEQQIPPRLFEAERLTN